MADREMTNEEAIEILGGIRACYNIFDEYDAPKYAALSKAIFALKAEPFNCSLEEFGECSYRRTGCSDCEVKEKVRNAIDKAEPKHGRWTTDYVEVGSHTGGVATATVTYCSVCDEQFDWRTPYCPNCGARMDERREDGNTD